MRCGDVDLSVVDGRAAGRCSLRGRRGSKRLDFSIVRRTGSIGAEPWTRIGRRADADPPGMYSCGAARMAAGEADRRPGPRQGGGDNTPSWGGGGWGSGGDECWGRDKGDGGSERGKGDEGGERGEGR